MLFILNKSHEVVGSLNSNGDLSRITTYFDDKYVQDLGTGAETFEFSTVANTEQAQHLVAGNFVAFKEDGEFKLFHIIQIEETHDDIFIKTCYCEMAGIELINEIIRPMKVLNSSLRKFLTTILEGTEWQLGRLDAGFTQVHDFEVTDYKSVYELIQEHAVGTYGAEISYRVEIEHGRIVGKYIDCYAQRGNNNGFRFAYGSNLTSVTKTVDTSNLATALIGVGKNGITFKEVDTPDKPLNSDFIANETAYKQWNINGSHIFGVHKEDTDSPQELLRLTRLALEERSNPKIKYEMKVELLGREVKIGDTVHIVDHEFNPPLYLSARVNQLTKSKTDPHNDEVVLANFKELNSNITEEMRALASQLEGYVEGQFPIGGDKIKDNAINSGHISSGTIQGTHIVADSIEAKHIQAGSIEAGHISAETIEGKHITSDTIESKHIKSNSIEAGHIQAGTIGAEHITANSIQSGHISSGTIAAEHIQTGAITAGSGIIADGAIGSAQISSLDAGKISSGTIDTSKITVQGANGHLRLQGNRMQVFDGRTKQLTERVSLGDVNGDGTVFGLRVRGKDGQTVLLDENGVTSEGITDGSITNDKVADNANISGTKLDIDSVISSINNDGTEVIQGTKIEVGGTNLEVKLSEITNQQDETNERITQAYSQITSNTEAIKLKVDEQTYQTDKTDMTSKLNKNTSEISTMKDQISLKVDKSEIENVKNELGETIDTKIVDAKAELKVETDKITQNISSNYYNKEDIDLKGYQTASQVQQTVDGLEVKVSQSGGYNLIYNGDFKRRLECWDANSDSWQYGEDEWTPNGRYIACIGELNTTKTCYVKNAMVFDKNAEAYTLSYWINTSTSGEDGTTNPYRRAELTVYYDDGSASWHSAGNQTKFATWEKHVVTVRKPPDKGFSHFALGLWCRDTTKKVHYSMVMIEKGVMANEWSPNPNEVYDGITTIDRDGITVTSTNTNTYTEMDASSFRVRDNNGGTVAEFSQNSRIPDLSAGIITASEVYANNLVKKSTYVKNYYVAGGYGNDTYGAGGSWNNPCKTVQYVLDNYVEDILDYDVNIYVGQSVPGWTCKSKSGKGVITFSIQDDCIVRDPLYLDNCTNRIAVNGTSEKRGTFMTGIVVTGCPNFDIGWVSFRGKNWAHNSGSCNVFIRNGSKGIVRLNDFNGCSYAIIVDNNSELWVYGNRGSDITHYIGIGAYTTIYGMRSGSDWCPDFTGHYYADAGHSNLYHIHDGANYTKTPSVGWSPSYTPTQKTQTWSFNKIWSDETLHGWSDRQELIQGYSTTWNTGRWTGYMQMTDGMAGIRNAISGGTNLSGRIYVQRTSSSGNSTGSKLCLYASDGTLITNSTTINRSQGVWVSLSSAIIQKIQSGAITYFYLKADSNNNATYFKCESNAKIEITYTN